MLLKVWETICFIGKIAFILIALLPVGSLLVSEEKWDETVVKWGRNHPIIVCIISMLALIGVLSVVLSVKITSR